jgi:hypothetical protein
MESAPSRTFLQIPARQTPSATQKTTKESLLSNWSTAELLSRLENLDYTAASDIEIGNS